jgi:hypothetical protein
VNDTFTVVLVMFPFFSYCVLKNPVVDLAHVAVFSTLLMPFKVIVKSDVVLSTWVVGAGVPPATGALVGPGVTDAADGEVVSIASGILGDIEGVSVTFGGALGVELGETVGDRVTITEGDADGIAVGLGVVGEALGSSIGVNVGIFDGNLVGTRVGDCVSSTGDF